jgi:DNA polymerase-3 subunit alpha
MVASRGFSNLHTHTEFSTFDGIARVNGICERAKALGMTALAITDHGSLAGAYKFSNAAKEAGIKPIIGIELYMAIGSRFEKNSLEVPRDDYNGDEEEGDTKSSTKLKHYEHLTVLARNTTGWKSLLAIHNAAQETVFYKPRADYALLKEHSEGLIVLTGCLAGPIAGPLLRDDFEEARDNLETLIDCVGKENVYLEIMDHGIDAESDILDDIVELSKEYGIPMVATNDSHYTLDCDEHAHDGFLAVGSNKNLSDPTRFRFNGSGYHLKSESEMREIHPKWSIWQEAVSMSQVIADRCDDEVIPAPVFRLPNFPIPAGFKDAEDYLWDLINKGIANRYGNKSTAEIDTRIDIEMDTITSMGFTDYFLIVWDMLNWCRTQGISLGFGRGSAAGSLVSYVLGIVGVDPLENNLLFERFLEPGRKGMPDIDVDIEAARRDEVLQYLQSRYGADRVAHIGQFGVSRSKASIKSAARILDLPAIGTALSVLVPVAEGGPHSLKRLEDTTDPSGDAFREALAKYGEDAQRVMELARGFEGVVTSAGTHPCGILITDEPISNLLPLRRNNTKDAPENALAIACWDGTDVDKYQLLKLDALGLRNLDVVSETFKSIERVDGIKLTIDTLPHPDTKNDPKVDAAWAILQRGQTAGIFQMESDGMAQVCRNIVPNSLDDLSAINALYRPGPLSAGMDASYAKRKSGAEKVSYTRFTSDAVEAEWIDGVMGATYGLAIYQETIMRLSTVIAGFDAPQRSRLRKAMGKKSKSEMDACHDMWISGAPKEFKDDKGVVISPVFRESTAKALWEFIEGSASYLFNASHSAAYAALAFVTAYLKANYSAHYGAGILAVTDSKNPEKRRAALVALREDGIKVLAPDVNRSLASTASDGVAVLLGLSEIKGVGSNGKGVVDEREKNGDFTSLHDLMFRVKVQAKKAKVPSSLSVSVVEGLIESGALDSLGTRKGLMMIMRAAKKNPALVAPGSEWNVLESSMRQRQRLGLTLGEHPMDALKEPLSEWRVPISSGSKKDRGEFVTGNKPVTVSRISKYDGSAVLTFGILASWEERSFSGGQMASFSLEDGTSVMSGTIWSNILGDLKRSKSIPAVGSIVAMSGTVKVRTSEHETEDGGSEVIQVSNLVPTAIWGVKVKAPSVHKLPKSRMIDLFEILDEIDDASPVVEVEEDDLLADLHVVAEPVPVTPVPVKESFAPISSGISVWGSSPGLGLTEIKAGSVDSSRIRAFMKSAPYTFETEELVYRVTEVKTGDQMFVFYSDSDATVQRFAPAALLTSRGQAWSACSSRNAGYEWEQAEVNY